MTRKRSFSLIHFLSTGTGLMAEIIRLGRLLFRSRAALMAENLFLRKQLAFYGERKIKPHRLSDAARLALVFWSRWFDWRNGLVVVKPETLMGWHRRAFQLFWRWKSPGGRPRIPKNLRALIAEMVRENPTWGQARVAAELSLKLGISVSSRTVRNDWPDDARPTRGPSSQRWMTFVRNHARAMLTCDFAVAITAGFRILYVFVVMEIGTRKLLQINATAHPTAAWTVQQLREAIPSDPGYRWLIHDRSGMFSAELDRRIQAMGVEVLLIGSLGRECLDWFLPVGERHLRTLLREWMVHYNTGRPHLSLGPGIPDAPPESPLAQRADRHQFPTGFVIRKKAILGGLHHEYRLERVAA